MGKIILISGPVKSGKTTAAEKMAKSAELNQIAYFATQANAFNDEGMKLRIEKHQQSRPTDWITIEEYKNLPTIIKERAKEFDGAIVDCITVWATNLFFDHLPAYYAEKNKVSQFTENVDLDAFIDTFQKEDIQYFHHYLLQHTTELITSMLDSEAVFWIVTNEVGWSIIQPTMLGRIFTDYIGQLNAYLAEHAEEVYMSTMGIQWRIKP